VCSGVVTGGQGGVSGGLCDLKLLQYPLTIFKVFYLF